MENCSSICFEIKDDYVEVTYENKVYSLQLPNTHDSHSIGSGCEEADGNFFEIIEGYNYEFYKFKDDNGHEYIDYDMALTPCESNTQVPIYKSIFIFFGLGDSWGKVYIVMNKHDLNNVVYLTLSSCSGYDNTALYGQSDSEFFDDMTTESKFAFKQAHKKLIAQFS